MRIASIGRAWIRKFVRQNQTVDLGIGCLKLKISFNKKDEPMETRVGFKKNDNSPFYDSNLESLYGIYYGYIGSPEYHNNILYAEIIGVYSDEIAAIKSPSIKQEEITIEISPPSYKVPPKLKEHGKFAVDCFKKLNKIRKQPSSEEWENAQSLRIDSFSSDNSKFVTSRAKYFDQVATNITLDWYSGKIPNKGHTIRNTIERPIDGKLKSLDSSCLANTIGVAVMLYNSDFEPFVRVRSDSLAAIQKRGLHCSASGVFEISDCTRDGKYDFSLIIKGIIAEINLELGISKDKYFLYPVAFARELPRGGKPQFFFIALTNLSDGEVKQISLNAEESWEFIPDSELSDNESNAGVKSHDDASKIFEMFTYEGWACLQFAEDFIEINKEYLQAKMNPK